jgi:hypothetical protein
MRGKFLAAALAGAGLLSLASVPAGAQQFSGKFSGFAELGALNNNTGAILSNGTGSITLKLDKSAQEITYELTYSGSGSN